MRIKSVAEEVRPNLTCQCLNFQTPQVEEFQGVVSVEEGEEELRFLAEGHDL